MGYLNQNVCVYNMKNLKQSTTLTVPTIPTIPTVPSGAAPRSGRLTGAEPCAPRSGRRTGAEPCSAGVDEAGRGPMFGPVYAAAVVLPDSFPPDDKMWEMIKDSKRLSAKKRELLAPYIESVAVCWGVGSASETEIDTVNILQATYLAMHRALGIAYAKAPFDSILVDGVAFKPYLNNAHEDGWIPFKCVPGGDNKHRHIAAASILAKTYHDRAIDAIIAANPDLEKYGLKTNKGYGTKTHMAALKEFGPSRFHRLSFAGAGIRNAVEGDEL